jgi:ribosomal protein S18 acetylase RimI-like enzyme
MTIRKATSKDRLLIERIAKKVGIFNYWFFYKLLIWWDRVFVVIIKKQVVAFASYLSIPGTDDVFFLQIGVDPSCQGQGVGKRLVHHLQAVVAKLHQAKNIWAHTLKPKALSWFRDKMKFRLIGSAFGVSVIKREELKPETPKD